MARSGGERFGTVYDVCWGGMVVASWELQTGTSAATMRRYGRGGRRLNSSQRRHNGAQAASRRSSPVGSGSWTAVPYRPGSCSLGTVGRQERFPIGFSFRTPQLCTLTFIELSPSTCRCAPILGSAPPVGD
jgi:hypothetical protein